MEEESKTDETLLQMLESGVEESNSFNIENLPAVIATEILILPDDSEETKTVKKNAEFIINSAMFAANELNKFGAMTQNPRFFEALATILNTMNTTNAQLITASKMDKSKKDSDESSPKTINNTVVLATSTSDIMRRIKEEGKIIDGN